ncbi:Rieske 2Fe-2S domain-containing protein [Streptosporangium sp. NPDC087985]|uniref:Rieske 2Fe-2S domain-containing protein n=1 Tax=Streptosporangium sp. NPDC087985 TaxID=3366196 RepID=UPI00381BFCCB
MSDLAEKLGSALQEDPERGIYRVNRSIFTDPELFDLEMKYIFEGNWVYLAHESQFKTNDYLTMNMGRQPVFISRNRQGELNAFINACAHRGAMLCRRKRDNKSTYTCPFHGWTFSNSGKLLKVKDPGPEAGYPEQFNTNGSHDLTRVPRFESYRGFLFGSLNADVRPLKEYLGEAAKIIDMLVDQSPDGLEVLRGASTYTYDGNWKVQAENGADGYHVSTLHWNYAATTGRRGAGGESATETQAMDVSTWQKQKGGFYSFENGHALLWLKWPDPEDRPIYPWRDQFIKEYGEARADWMVGYLRNLLIYPNLYLMDALSSQIRHFHPVSVDKTEVTIYCIAPKGESAEMRESRLRQYEDFYNATGMATPDDLEEFRACQRSYLGRAARWNDMSRGATHWITGPDENAKALGINPMRSGVRAEDEGLYPIMTRHWLEIMTKAAVAEGKISKS